MAKNLKVNGIIIAENNSGDSDKMLTMLTPNLGKISCTARGARRTKSQLLAATQMFTFGEYMLFKGGDTYTINSCETIEMFYNLRTDLDKLTYASHITKIINDVTTENQNSFHILKLYLNTLYAMSETDKDLDFILSVFKMRLMKIIGFAPNVSECVSCKSKENLSAFSFKDNGFKCDNCKKQEPGSFNITEATKNAIIYSTKADGKKIFSFNLSEKASKEFEIVSRLYLNEKLEKEYKIEKLF
ncbi:MAG: DNA repair protein RecO [Clostridia bacterium]|nr:DNA repair protein RecO [Clostridia bacterium]